MSKTMAVFIIFRPFRCMYEKIATVTVSIEETVSLGQGERSPDRQGLLFSQRQFRYLKKTCIFGLMFTLDINLREKVGSQRYKTSYCPALVAQGASMRCTGHILEALLPQGELRE